MGLYDEYPDRPIDGRESFQDVIVEEAASLVRVDLSFLGRRFAPKWFSDQQEFCRRLEMDGFASAREDDGTLSG